MKKILIIDVNENENRNLKSCIKITYNETEGVDCWPNINFEELHLPSNLKEIIETLQTYNQWRRDDDWSSPPDPTEVGIALDEAIEILNILKGEQP